MLPILVLVLAVVFSVVMDGISSQNWELAKEYKSQSTEINTYALAEALELFYVETNAFPASISSLANTSGYEFVRGFLGSQHGYTVSSGLVDTQWVYSRAIVFSFDPTTGKSSSEYLNENHCGTGSSTTAISWCGSKDSKWYRRETRERYNELIGTQRARMGRTLQKFATYYNHSSEFPNKDSLNVTLPSNSISSLKSLVGYPGTATNCSGSFSYMGIPIDCGDMFDVWGGDIGYQYIAGNRIILVAESPIFNSTGTRLVIATEYDYSLL